MNHKNKSKIKASGFKSAFIVGDKVVTTSFGKGNAAILEKEVTDDVVRELNASDSNYNLNIATEKGRKKYKIKGRWINNFNKDSNSGEKNIVVTGDDPREYSIMRDDSNERIGMDVIRIKDKVEEEIFGKAFSEDNIHIQLAYNILDIQKILAVYVNNIVYSLNNLAHRKNGSDFIGMFPSCSTLEDLRADEKLRKKFEQFTNDIFPYMFYHPAVFYEQIENDNNNDKKKDDLFTLFRILSDVRQSCVHSENSMYVYDVYAKNDTHIKEKRKYLDKMYNKKISQVNDDFVNNNKTNLYILYKLYNIGSAEQKSEIVNSYYKFIVTQESKNLGFSIREIRERMLEKYLGKIKEKGYDSIRGKMYTLIDFIIYRYYTDASNAAVAERFVNSLRSSLSDEARIKLYDDQSNSAFKNLKSILNSLITMVNARSICDLITEAERTIEIDIAEIKIKQEATYFVKMLYVLTLFLDGKEINELISSLINKFDNIASFICVMKECGIPCNFENEYKFFDGSEKISRELCTLKSFARMKIEIPKVTKKMYNDAVCILGLKDKEGNLILEYNDELYTYLMKYVDKKLCVSKESGNKKDTGMRNFLINNVIKSRRFWYVIRYINPQNARRLMNNSAIVRFVLERLPEEQIERYYKSVTEYSDVVPTVNEQVNHLCNMLLGMNINYFESVPQKATRDKQDIIKKERYKAVIGLYLTVLYLLTKNLVKVNSRYTTACCCLERDSKLHGLIEYDKHGKPDYENFCGRLVEKALEEKWINKQYRGYFRKADKPRNKEAGNDRKHYNKQLHKSFRNAIVHLNAVMEADKYIDGIKNIDSYFMIYHYIMQRYLSNGQKQGWLGNSPAEKQLEAAKQHNTYSKNVVKGLCLPFGYNLSRFKNLTIMEVFNRQEILEERKKNALENNA